VFVPARPFQPSLMFEGKVPEKAENACQGQFNGSINGDEKMMALSPDWIWTGLTPTFGLEEANNFNQKQVLFIYGH
jgi:hypothetical protein